MTVPDTDAPRHGGDLTYAHQRYGEPAGGWLDLSTGINPHPYPAAPVDSALLQRLPDRRQLAALIDAARTAYGAPIDVSMAAVAGSEPAIQGLPRLLPHERVGIVGPTYGSHREGWAATAKTVIDIPALDDIPSDIAVVVIANPNNPDGRAVPPEALRDTAERLGDRGGLLIVDEAFTDLAPDQSLVPQLRGLAAVVLRSFGKFYGLPGLRLGFVAGEPNLLCDVVDLHGAWPVSGPALAIGTQALADNAWAVATRKSLHAEAGRLRRSLVAGGLTPIGGTDLFVLVETVDAHRLHQALAHRGIWTRTFRERPTWLRVGLPGSDADFVRLDAALADCAMLKADR